LSGYTEDVTSSVAYQKNLTETGLRALIYRWISVLLKTNCFSFTDFPGILSNNCPEIFLICSGDHDISVPWVATYAWIKALGVAVFDEWRPWYLDGQIAG